jgi:bile acid:Na+ symporter, BASS family
MAHSGTNGHRGSWLHRHFLPLLIGTYMLAAIVPLPGQFVQSLQVRSGTASATTPAILLAALLFSAGLGTRLTDAKQAVRRPMPLLAGVIASVVVPFLLVVGTSLVLGGWHDPHEVQCLIVGLGLVAAMPIAGSSVAWAQTAGGNAAFSVGLVLSSTVLSPLTTPFALKMLDPMVSGAAGDALSGLTAGSALDFLVWGVVVPTMAGITVRVSIGPTRTAQVLPTAKLVSTGVLLTLCYINASTALPALVAKPDWDFLGLVVAATGVMCALGFLTGATIGRIVRLDRSGRVALTYGLGMSNNGTALVVAGSAFAGLPEAIISVVVYNLVQHVGAALTARILARRVAAP